MIAPPAGHLSWSEYWRAWGLMILGRISYYWRPALEVVGVIAVLVSLFVAGYVLGAS